MEHICLRCTRLALGEVRGGAGRAPLGLRAFTTTHLLQEKDDGKASGIAKAGKPLKDALPSSDAVAQTTPRRFTITRVDPLVRRTVSDDSASRHQILRRTGPGSAQPGQLLMRTRPAAGGPLVRPAGGRPGSRSPADRRPGGVASNRKPRDAPRDKRRRRARDDNDDEVDSEQQEREMDEYIEKYIDRPDNASVPLPYHPKQLQLDDLSSDWPNTPLSTKGMTESVVQKIEWLSERLPRGYISSYDLAQRYLRGDFVRFESEAEKQEVVKLAFEEKATRERDKAMGVKRGWVPNQIPLREDPVFMSLADEAKKDDKSYLLDTAVKGDYPVTTQQKYPFLQNVARQLANNETYGPVQAQKLLDRVQALIPQARGARAQVAKA